MTRGVLSLLTAAFMVSATSVARGELLLHYNFDEARSGTAAVVDRGAAPAADGTFVGGTTRTNATPGGVSRAALDLGTGTEGGNHYVNGGNAAKLNALTQLTITLWINLRQNAIAGDRLVSWGNAFDVNLPSGGFTATALRLGFMISDNYANSSGTFDALNKWVFVACTWDGVTRRYYTGEEDRASAVTQLAGTSGFTTTPTRSPSTTFRVGGTALASNRTPPAWIDDVRVYSTALTLAELERVRLANITRQGTTVLVR